jgi:nitrite reductase (NADH) small subunit
MKMEHPVPDPVVRQATDEQLLIEIGGRRILTEAACPHRKGRLRFGYLNGRALRITCPLHHSTFDLLTGQQISGPVCRPLRVTVLAADVADPTVSGDQESVTGLNIGPMS